MSKLNPSPGVLVFGGVERHLFFDYAAIEKLQELYDTHPFSILQQIFAKDDNNGAYYKAKPLIDIAYVLINNEIGREKALEGTTNLTPIDRDTLAHMIDLDNADSVVGAIISAWTGQTPQGEAEEDEDEDAGGEPEEVP